MEHYITFTFRTHAYINLLVNERYTCVHCLYVTLHNAHCTVQYNTIHYAIMNPNKLHLSNLSQYIEFHNILLQTNHFLSLHLFTTLVRFCNICMIKWRLYWHNTLHNICSSLTEVYQSSNLSCNVGCTFLTSSNICCSLLWWQINENFRRWLHVFTGRVCRGAIQFWVSSYYR